MAAQGQSTARSGKAALGAALVARGLAGSRAGARKSPGLLGSLMLTLIGGLFFGVGVYVNTHAAALAAKPGNSGSPKLLGWGFVGIGGLVLLVGALTLLSRLGALIIGGYLLIAGRSETTAIPPVAVLPTPQPETQPQTQPQSQPQTPLQPQMLLQTQPQPQTPESASVSAGGSASAPLVPPPLDPRLPRPTS